MPTQTLQVPQAAPIIGGRILVLAAFRRQWRAGVNLPGHDWRFEWAAFGIHFFMLYAGAKRNLQSKLFS